MSNDRTPVIASAARTAIGSFGGSLSTISAPDLGAVAIKAAIVTCSSKPSAQPTTEILRALRRP